MNLEPSVNKFSVRTTCRLCTSKDLKLAIPMVSIPRGDGYVPPELLHETKETFPLGANYCGSCGNVQTNIDVDQSFIYKHYLWTTGISPGLTALYKSYSNSVVDRFFKARTAFAVELGSNDGTFSKFLQQKGLKVLAIDPAENLAAKANEEGVETLAEFFEPELAKRILAERGAADLIVANHMFANINDVDTIVAGVKHLLARDGVFIIQVFYLYDVVKGNLLENFNHEHPSYYYVRTLQKFFAANGMQLFDVEHVPAKGGSIRCFIQWQGGPNEVSLNVSRMIEREEALGLHHLESYGSVTKHIEDTRESFQKFFAECKAQGKTVAGYGTSIGATIFTYQYGLGDSIDFFVDDDPVRHGLASPGYGIPVKPPEALYDLKPDFVVLMAPLYADLIMKKHEKFAREGGRFVKFRPDFEVI